MVGPRLMLACRSEEPPPAGAAPLRGDEAGLLEGARVLTDALQAGLDSGVSKAAQKPAAHLPGPGLERAIKSRPRGVFRATVGES